MDKLTKIKDKLTEIINSKTSTKQEKEEELNNLLEIFQTIDNYNILSINKVCFGVLILFCTAAACFLPMFIKGLIIAPTTIIRLIVIPVFVASLAILICDIKLIKRFYWTIKDIKSLEKNGVKELEEQEYNLRERKLDLEAEISNLESAIDQHNNFLELLDSMGNDYEETEETIDDKLAYESLLENYLNERIDYSKVQINIDKVGQVKLSKKYD